MPPTPVKAPLVPQPYGCPRTCTAQRAHRRKAVRDRFALQGGTGDLVRNKSALKKRGETSSGVIILIGEMLGGGPVSIPSTSPAHPRYGTHLPCAGGIGQSRTGPWTDPGAGSWAWGGVGGREASDRAHDSPISTSRLSRRQFPLQTPNTGRPVGDAQGVDENSHC